jgi:hypothetical protein
MTEIYKSLNLRIVFSYLKGYSDTCKRMTTRILYLKRYDRTKITVATICRAVLLLTPQIAQNTSPVFCIICSLVQEGGAEAAVEDYLNRIHDG